MNDAHLEQAIYEDKEEFRDRIATIDDSGKRVWIYPKKPSGRFYNARSWVSLIFLIIFLGMPFIKIDGEQFLMINILERRFVLFGLVFTPQDFHLFVLAMLTFLVFIILFTVVFGRLFCGWVCPQTIFMEMVYRKIEYWIEGDANDQRKLNNAPWNAVKIRKKALKHFLFFSIAVVVANYFLAYIIGMDKVLVIVSEPISNNLGGFIAMVVFSYAFYGVFAFMREQVCTTICPYGRMQSVLLVKDSVVVAYDHVRGEPRGKIKKGQDRKSNPLANIQQMVGTAAATAEPAKTLGDCVDCKLCIHVCPTGIDIRNGTQLECVNCTACIDACDAVMDKVGRERGLIRYDSMTGIESGKRKIFTPRVFGYSAILLILLIVDVVLISRRGDMEAIILRAPGQLYQQKDETHLSNLYNYTLINKTSKELPIEVVTTTEGAVLRVVGEIPHSIPKGGKIKGTFFIDMPSDHIKGRKTPINIEIQSGGKAIEKVETNFMGPASGK